MFRDFWIAVESQKKKIEGSEKPRGRKTVCVSDEVLMQAFSVGGWGSEKNLKQVVFAGDAVHGAAKVV